MMEKSSQRPLLRFTELVAGTGDISAPEPDTMILESARQSDGDLCFDLRPPLATVDQDTELRKVNVPQQQTERMEEQSPEHTDVVGEKTGDWMAAPTACSFLARMTKPVPPPIMPTPATKKKKVTFAEEEDEGSVRRRGCLMQKQKQSRNKKAEELAQEVLAKMLGVLTIEKELNKATKSKLLNLFECPLPKEAMQAIEDLLMALNIDSSLSSTRKAKVAAKKG